MAHIESTMTGVVLVCACSHRSEGRTKTQAADKHEAHRNITQIREAIEPKDPAG